MEKIKKICKGLFFNCKSRRQMDKSNDPWIYFKDLLEKIDKTQFERNNVSTTYDMNEIYNVICNNIFVMFYGKKHAKQKFEYSLKKAKDYIQSIVACSIKIEWDTIMFKFKNVYSKQIAETDEVINTMITKTEYIAKTTRNGYGININNMFNLFKGIIFICGGLHIWSMYNKYDIPLNILNDYFMGPDFIKYIKIYQKNIIMRTRLYMLNSKLKNEKKKYNIQKIIMEFFNITKRTLANYIIKNFCNRECDCCDITNITYEQLQKIYQFLYPKQEMKTISYLIGGTVFLISNRELMTQRGNIIVSLKYSPLFINETDEKYNIILDELQKHYHFKPLYITLKEPNAACEKKYIINTNTEMMCHIIEKIDNMRVQECVVCTRKVVNMKKILKYRNVVCNYCFADIIDNVYKTLTSPIGLNRFYNTMRFENIFKRGDWLRISLIYDLNVNCIFIDKKIYRYLTIINYSRKLGKKYRAFLEELHITGNEYIKIQQEKTHDNEIIEITEDSNIRKCPLCMCLIEKTGGCNAITCPHCTLLFCFQCISPVNVLREDGQGIYTCKCGSITRFFQHDEDVMQQRQKLYNFTNNF